MEDYNNYKAFCTQKITEFMEAYPSYTFGQAIHCIKYFLRRDSDKSFFEATDAQIYRAISIAIEKEESNRREIKFKGL